MWQSIFILSLLSNGAILYSKSCQAAYGPQIHMQMSSARLLTGKKEIVLAAFERWPVISNSSNISFTVPLDCQNEGKNALFTSFHEHSDLV